MFLQRVLGGRVGAVLRELDRRRRRPACTSRRARPTPRPRARAGRAACRAGPASRRARRRLVLVAVHLRIADVVAGEAVRLDEQEDRARSPERACSSASRASRRPPRRPGRRPLIVVMPNATRALGHGPRSACAASAGVDSAQRLFSQTKTRRHPPELREVERLVERADVRRAVAEERERDARLAAQLERERRRRRSPAARRRRRRSRRGCPRSTS